MTLSVMIGKLSRMNSAIMRMSELLLPLQRILLMRY